MKGRPGGEEGATRLLFRLLRECRYFPFQLALALLSLIGLGAAQLALPWAVKRWVEGPLTQGSAVDIRPLTTFALLIIGCLALFMLT